MDSIGLQQPIVVQKEGGRYKILVGQRRFLAAKQLGWEDIPARVVKGLDQPTAILWSISENIHRRDLTPRDKSNACKYLLDQFHSTVAVAEQIGSSERTVKKWLGYYHIVPEEMKQMVDEKRISASTALRIAENVSDKEKAIAIAREVPVGRRRGTKADRDRFLSAVEEDPQRPLPSIQYRAQELQRQKRVNFILPPQWADPLELASKDLLKEEGDIARDALIEWLRTSQYQGGVSA